MRTSLPHSGTIIGFVLILGACAAPEPATLLLSGHLLGNDGTAMAAAEVQLISPLEFWNPGIQAPLQSVSADAEGAFTLSHQETGIYFLRFTGIGHAWKAVPIVVEEPVELSMTVRLGLPEYSDDFGAVTVIGDFNDFKPETGLEMEARSDGTYFLRLPVDADTLAYQLTGVGTDRFSHTLNGTDSERVTFDGHTSYKSVIDVQDGLAEVVFDPSMLSPPGKPAVVTFADPSSRSATLATLWSEQEQLQKDFKAAMERAAESGEEIQFDLTRTTSALVQRLEGETDSLSREAYFLNLLHSSAYGGKLDPALAKATLQGVGPGSALWALYPSTPLFPSSMGDMIGRVVGDQIGEEDFEWSTWLKIVTDFVDEAADAHPNAEVRAEMLLAATRAAHIAENEEVAGEYFDRLYSLSQSSAATRWARTYSPRRIIQAGSLIPDFVFPPLDPSANPIDRESLLGTVYLLDFWATWCAPCVMELPNLHEVFEEFASQGFQIVSVSFDRKPEDVSAFRAARWPMPWLHAHLPDGFNDPATDLFEMTGIPKVILVDSDGTIIGADSSVEGENLRDVLANRFSSESS